MFKLKHKVQGEELQHEEFKTLQEVAARIKQLTDAETLQEVLKAQKEFNIRFYITYKAG